jgi:hypothetical protein
MFLTHQSITTLCHLIKTFISYVIFFNFLSKLSVTNTCTWIKYKEYFGAKFLRKDFADKKFLSNFLDILQKVIYYQYSDQVGKTDILNIKKNWRGENIGIVLLFS